MSPFFIYLCLIQLFYVTGLVPSSAEPPSLRRTPRANATIAFIVKTCVSFASTSTSKETEKCLLFLIVFLRIFYVTGLVPSSAEQR